MRVIIWNCELFSYLAHLDALEGDLELEGVLEVAGIIQHHHIADMNLGHAAEQPHCPGETASGSWSGLKIARLHKSARLVATRQYLAMR